MIGPKLYVKIKLGASLDKMCSNGHWQRRLILVFTSSNRDKVCSKQQMIDPE